jgi:arginyl-tRNA--protein-N-Asp/Glu arginylyltransferase
LKNEFIFIDCPPCYREVQKRVNRYRKDLNLLQNAILTLNSSQTLNSLREDKRLTSELDSLASNLNNLKIDLHSNEQYIFFQRYLHDLFRSGTCLSKYIRL